MSVHNLDHYYYVGDQGKGVVCRELTEEEKKDKKKREPKEMSAEECRVKNAKLVIVAFIGSWVGGAIKFKVNLKKALEEANKDLDKDHRLVECVLVCAEELKETLIKQCEPMEGCYIVPHGGDKNYGGQGDLIMAAYKHYKPQHWPWVVAVKMSDGSHIPAYVNQNENNFFDINDKGGEALTEYLKQC